MKEQRNTLLANAQAILNEKPYSKMSEARFMSIMKLVDAIDADRGADVRAVAASTKLAEIRGEEVNAKELRAEAEFKSFVNYRGQEKRTYVALSEGAAPGSYNIPSQWRREYSAKLVSASGWLQAGITVKNTLTGKPYISFFDDDSANVASIIAENSALPQANPTFTAPTATPVAFASATLLSNQLNQDVQNGSFDVDGFVQTLLGKRVGRALNTFITSDSTYGILASIDVSATAASTSVPTLGELADMQNAVNSAYMETDSKPVYTMSQTLRNRLLKQLDTAGRRVFPEIQDGRLLGLPLIINSDFGANAGDTAVVCGSIARLAIVEDVQPALIKSVERYAEYFQTMYGIVHRLGVKIVDSNAAVSLKLHA
jgi:HK97 family phage major capsid protein